MHGQKTKQVVVKYTKLVQQWERETTHYSTFMLGDHNNTLTSALVTMLMAS